MYMCFYIDQVVSIQAERSFVAAHTASVAQTTAVIGGINKIGEMMASLLGESAQWTKMEAPSPEEVPETALSILNKGQTLTQSIPVPFQPLYNNLSESDQQSDPEQPPGKGQHSFLYMKDYPIHNPSLLELAARNLKSSETELDQEHSLSQNHSIISAAPRPECHNRVPTQESQSIAVTGSDPMKNADRSLDPLGQYIDDNDTLGNGQSSQ